MTLMTADGRCERLRYEYLIPYDVMSVVADGVCDRSEPPLVNGAGVASRYETSWHRAVLSRLKRVLKQFTGTWRMHNYLGYAGNECDAPPAASSAAEGASRVHVGSGCDDSLLSDFHTTSNAPGLAQSLSNAPAATRAVHRLVCGAWQPPS